jgi:hypothetical protein
MSVAAHLAAAFSTVRRHGVVKKTSIAKDIRSVRAKLYAYLDEETKHSAISMALTRMEQSHLDDRAHADLVLSKQSGWRSHVDFKTEVTERLHVGGFLSHTLSRRTTQGLESMSPRQLVSALDEFWSASTAGRTKKAYNVVFSIHPGFMSAWIAAGLDPNLLLLTVTRRALERFSRWAYPDDRLGYVVGIHHDRPHIHAHLLLYPVTEKGKGLNLSPNASRSFSANESARIDFQGYLSASFDEFVRMEADLGSASPAWLLPPSVSSSSHSSLDLSSLAHSSDPVRPSNARLAIEAGNSQDLLESVAVARKHRERQLVDSFSLPSFSIDGWLTRLLHRLRSLTRKQLASLPAPLPSDSVDLPHPATMSWRSPVPSSSSAPPAFPSLTGGSRARAESLWRSHAKGLDLIASQAAESIEQKMAQMRAWLASERREEMVRYDLLIQREALAMEVIHGLHLLASIPLPPPSFPLTLSDISSRFTRARHLIEALHRHQRRRMDTSDRNAVYGSYPKGMIGHLEKKPVTPKHLLDRPELTQPRQEVSRELPFDEPGPISRTPHAESSSFDGEIARRLALQETLNARVQSRAIAKVKEMETKLGMDLSGL